MFHVERFKNGVWHKMMFTENRSRLYCDYPSDPMRIMKVEQNGDKKIIRETKGKGKVTT